MLAFFRSCEVHKFCIGENKFHLPLKIPLSMKIDFYKFLQNYNFVPKAFFRLHVKQMVLQLLSAIICLYPFSNLKTHFFISASTIFNIFTCTHSFCTFNKKTPKNGYTSAKSIHFSMILKSVCLKKMTPKSQAKNKPHFRNTHF